MEEHRVSVYRKEHFNAAHRIYVKDWSNEKNAEVFGKCSNPNYHGHNYDLTVKVTGVVNPTTGYVMDLKKLSDIINEQVIDRFDHKNLNEDCVEFKDLIPTAENIVIVIYKLIKTHLDEAFDLKVTLYETPRNFVEYPAN